MPTFYRDEEISDTKWDTLYKLLLHQLKYSSNLNGEFYRDSKQTTVENEINLQHYGAPTRLYDVTSNPLIALFFAVCKEDDDNDGIVFVYDEQSKIVGKNFTDLDHHNVINLATSNKRIKAQEGYCIFYSKKEEKRAIKEINISNKAQIKQELEVLGIKKSIIYPTLDNEISDIINKYKKGAKTSKDAGSSMGDSLSSMEFKVDAEEISKVFPEIKEERNFSSKDIEFLDKIKENSAVVHITKDPSEQEFWKSIIDEIKVSVIYSSENKELINALNFYNTSDKMEIIKSREMAKKGNSE